MKWTKNSNQLLAGFLILLCIANLLQGYFTELLPDEAYYWMYSNFLDWGYFDHPPMVAVWITISKFFFSSGELSVRFFSAFTLSINFYLVWLLIKHPQKKEYTWLFILILLTTSLFNVYGSITVPDTPLMFFTAIFLYGYQQYLDKKSLLSYAILAVSMACMMYSKYQAILVIGFVILSNFKLLTDYKLWITAFVAIGLFFPHLYWQFENNFPSFKYHLFERKENTEYRFRDTYMHLINMIAIIGLTFPIVYKALFKNLKTTDLFQRALNFIAIGFVVFFFISTFKGHAQAQWIVPISIPFIVITFNYLLEHKNELKLFKILAIITLVVTTFIRFAMAIDGLLPKQFDMHGNKAWIEKVEDKIGDHTPLFLNSYQRASSYWFYSGNRPHQYNSWDRRKNQYDLLDYNKNFDLNNVLLVGGMRKFATDSMVYKNGDYLYLSSIGDFKKKKLVVSFDEIPTLEKKKQNTFKVNISDNNLEGIRFKVVLKNKDKVSLKTPTKDDHPDTALEFDATIKNDNLSFYLNDFDADFTPAFIQIVGNTNPKTRAMRMSTVEKCNFKNE